MKQSQLYTASVIADSISPQGHRLTTLLVCYPHAVHKDMLRHRCASRNVESFRAQKPEDLIHKLRNGHAFKPEVFAARVKGMGQGAEEVKEAVHASRLWDEHVYDACERAELFLRMGIAKQQINFLLQDLCPLTEVITATDWSNFYALRTELKDDGTPVARPEVYKTAVAIRDAIETSSPVLLEPGQLHLPMVTEEELGDLCQVRKDGNPVAIAQEEDRWIGVSAGRTAKISYGDYRWWEEPPPEGYNRSRRLLTAGHMSPFEQQARCFSDQRWGLVRALQGIVNCDTSLEDYEKVEMSRQLEYSGNLHGWVPARKAFPNEHDYGLLKKSLEEALV